MNNEFPSNIELKPSDLHGILRYVKLFRKQIFVIGIQVSLSESPNFDSILKEITILHSLKIQIIIFFYEASESSINLLPAKAYISPGIQSDLIELYNCDIKNNQKDPKAPIEYNFEALEAELKHSKLCLLSTEDPIININTEHFLQAIFSKVKAEKLILVGDHECPIIDGEPLTNIAASELKDLLISNDFEKFPDWFKHQSQIAIEAIALKVQRVHLLNGTINNALLNELFDKVGIGTMIHANKYETIRSAESSDVPALLHLTQNSVKKDTLLNRSTEAILSNIEHYFVYEIDGSIVACTCISSYPEEDCIEIGSVFVQPYYNGRGIGRKLVQAACEKGKTQGHSTAFAITSNAANFFVSKCHFKEANIDALPAARKIKFKEAKRNSLILTKSLF